MKDRAILALALGLGALSVLVDFTSAVLSVLSDAALVGAGAFAVAAVLRRKREQVRALRAENDELRALAKARGADVPLDRIGAGRG